MADEPLNVVKVHEQVEQGIRWKTIFFLKLKKSKKDQNYSGLSSDCRLQQWQYLSPGAQRQFKRKKYVILS